MWLCDVAGLVVHGPEGDQPRVMRVKEIMFLDVSKKDGLLVNKTALMHAKHHLASGTPESSAASH